MGKLGYGYLVCSQALHNLIREWIVVIKWGFCLISLGKANQARMHSGQAEIIGGRLGEHPMTGVKLGNKQSERLVKKVNKHCVTYSTIYLYICISLGHPLIYVILMYHSNVLFSPGLIMMTNTQYYHVNLYLAFS